jgi:hypothetical protein
VSRDRISWAIVLSVGLSFVWVGVEFSVPGSIVIGMGIPGMFVPGLLRSRGKSASASQWVATAGALLVVIAAATLFVASGFRKGSGVGLVIVALVGGWAVLRPHAAPKSR